ncbi:TetR/AcrR family transcriptional regulator [Candidatus Bathyarchaeota archaeon]|nr:TetR/AcrR family transcriptional regulator [Candidatus Bathyarchaeota archaeon]
MMPRVLQDYKIRAKKRIIEAAITVFAKKGYHRAKMTDIAKEVGVSKGTLYQYFKSKEDLFEAVVQIPFEKIEEEPLAELLESGNLLDISSNSFYDKLWSTPLFFSEPSWPPSLMFEIVSEASRKPKLANSLQRMYDDALKYLTTFFEDQKEKGIIRRDVNTHNLALGLIALQDGLQGYELFGMDRSETEKAWSEISNTLLTSVITNEKEMKKYRESK